MKGWKYQYNQRGSHYLPYPAVSRFTKASEKSGCEAILLIGSPLQRYYSFLQTWWCLPRASDLLELWSVSVWASFKPHQYCCQGLYPSGQKESLSQFCYRWRIIPLTLSNEVTGIALIFWLRYISFYIPLILAECTSFPFCIQDCSWKLIARFSLAWKKLYL